MSSTRSVETFAPAVGVAVALLLTGTGCDGTSAGNASRVSPDHQNGLSGPGFVEATPRQRSWPNLFGPGHDNVAPVAGSSIPAWGDEGPREAWRIPCGTGYSSPVVWEDRLILLHRIDDEERVTCYDSTSARVIWEQSYPTSFECGSHYTHGPYSTPATDGEVVYTLGAQGQLHCWSLEDGELLWQRLLADEFQVPTEIFGQGHSPLLWGNKLILNVGGTTPNSGVVAFNRQSGDILWQSTSHGASYATPQPARIHDHDWLFVLTRRGLSLLDPESGAEQWMIPFEPTIPDAVNAVTPLVSDDLVWIAAWGVGTKVIRIAEDGSYNEVWFSRRSLTSQYTPLLSVGDCVIGVHALDNSLRCVEWDTGDLRWRWKSELANSKHIRVGNQIVLYGEYGHLGLADCRTDELGESCVTAQGLFGGKERCFSAPAYAAGRLYVRSESKIVCLDLQNVRPADQTLPTTPGSAAAVSINND